MLGPRMDSVVACLTQPFDIKHVIFIIATWMMCVKSAVRLDFSTFLTSIWTNEITVPKRLVQRSFRTSLFRR